MLNTEVDNIIEVEVKVDPQGCKHEWKICFTPPDSGHKWYRCRKCGVFGHPKKPFSWLYRTKYKNFIIPYRCSINKCNGLAIERNHGRGPRCSYLWRCKDHVNTE